MQLLKYKVDEISQKKTSKKNGERQKESKEFNSEEALLTNSPRRVAETNAETWL